MLPLGLKPHGWTESVPVMYYTEIYVHPHKHTDSVVKSWTSLNHR